MTVSGEMTPFVTVEKWSLTSLLSRKFSVFLIIADMTEGYLTTRFLTAFDFTFFTLVV